MAQMCARRWTRHGRDRRPVHMTAVDADDAGEIEVDVVRCRHLDGGWCLRAGGRGERLRSVVPTAERGGHVVRWEVVAVRSVDLRLRPFRVALDGGRRATVDQSSEVECNEVRDRLCLAPAEDLASDVEAERGHDHQYDEGKRDDRKDRAA